MIEVLIAEDQTLVREGIRSLLGLLPDIEVIGEAADGEQALALVHAHQHALLLLDIRMPILDGLELLKRLNEENHLPPTIVLTTFDDAHSMLQAIQSGAKGFLLKDVTLEQLATAIRAVAAGGTMLQPGLTERLLLNLRQKHADSVQQTQVEPLSSREAQVIRMMVGGYRNKEIAEVFGVAEGTIKNHVSSILAKLGTRDRTQAVLTAIARGLI